MAIFLPKAVASYAAISADEVQETEYLSPLFSKSFPFQLKQSKTPQVFDEPLIELSVLIGAISGIPQLRSLDLQQDELAAFVIQALECHLSILSSGAYPKSWLSLHIYHHRATVDSLEYLSSILTRSFIPPPEDAETFDTNLWKLFFITLMNVVSSDSLALENFPEQKRRAVWKVGGDIREQGAALLQRTWAAIGWEAVGNEKERYGLGRFGGYQVQYVPSLVFPIVKLCISVHEKLRHVAVGLLWSLIASEWQLNGNLSIIEAEIIASLDLLFKTNEFADSAVCKLFVADLYDTFQGITPHEDTEFSGVLRKFFCTVDELLDLLATNYCGNVSENMNTLRLMEFMKNYDKEDIFVRYVHDLAYNHAAAGNYAEAGLALKFHADLYDWEASRIVSALENPDFPVQTSFERKEYLYRQMIRYFEKGKAWSQALSCYKELADYYENVALDYAKLSRATIAIGRIYNSIVKNDKRYPRYFRVTFKGLGFPDHLRDKQYIIEGSPSERMITFTDRMQKEYPTAKIVSSKDFNNYEGQYLHISSVSIHRNLSHPIHQRPRVPLSVREHLLTSEPSLFSVVSSRFTSGNDYREHWVTKTVFSTAEAFPNVLRRSEIIESSEITLNALDTAIERTWRKTQELLALYKRAYSGSETGMHALKDSLRQLLDVGSSATTSVAIYHGFLRDDQARNTDNEPDTAPDVPQETSNNVNALRVALFDHAMAIQRCLALFTRPAYLHVYNDLKDLFESIFAEEYAAMIEYTSQLDQDYDDSVVETEKPEIGVANVVSAMPGNHAYLNGSNGTLSRRLSTAHSHASFQVPKINVFKRKDHKPTISTATVTQEIPEDLKRDRLEARPEIKIDTSNNLDDGLSRTTSKDGKSVKSLRTPFSVIGGTARDSWFSHNGKSVQGEPTAVQDTRTRLLTSTPATSTEDLRSVQQRITDRVTRGALSKETACKGTPSIRSIDSRKENTPSTPFSGGSVFSLSSRGTEHMMSLLEAAEMPVVSTRQSGKRDSGVTKKGSVRGSMMKRFSLLKTGKKGNRTSTKETSLNLSLKEE
ncbi:hypothetical protein KEM54_001780 [Ascosphaera aggregata]|nr:hypothetical protein KEM54_001780 [Ascosphaera aggregata]